MSYRTQRCLSDCDRDAGFVERPVPGAAAVSGTGLRIADRVDVDDARDDIRGRPRQSASSTIVQGSSSLHRHVLCTAPAGRREGWSGATPLRMPRNCGRFSAVTGTTGRHAERDHPGEALHCREDTRSSRRCRGARRTSSTPRTYGARSSPERKLMCASSAGHSRSRPIRIGDEAAFAARERRTLMNSTMRKVALAAGLMLIGAASTARAAGTSTIFEGNVPVTVRDPRRRCFPPAGTWSSANRRRSS